MMISNACCVAVAAVLGNKTSFPWSSAYNSSLSSYWAQQEQAIQPSCIVQPTSATEVAVLVSALVVHNDCSFAIRSGGHSPNAGAANMQAGVTIDLSHLDTITVSDDRTSVSVGPGATWDAVYSTLDPLNITVAGGREAGVGVGGLTLGGGISFFSPRVGFTCDTVLNYQVVLANGDIVNSKNDANLHRALSGGSNNFGIVTRIDYSTVAYQGLVWGGQVSYLIDTIDDQLQALADFTNPDSYDEYSSLIMTLVYVGTSGLSLVVNGIEYTKEETEPAVFQPFLDIPAISNTMQLDTLGNIATEMASTSVDGERSLFMTITHGNSPEMLASTFAAWNNSVANITSLISSPGDITWSLSLEPLPPAIYTRGTNNALGLDGRQGTLIVALLTALWTDATHDDVLKGTAETLFGTIRDAAKGLGELDDFLYLNYANKAGWQGNPIAGYGSESVERLRKTQQEVDPRGVFQTKVPGGFKLP